MTKIKWHETGARRWETGVSHGVLYLRTSGSAFDNGVPWNGLVSVSEAPTGAESTKVYADNIAYLNLISVEEYTATIEALTYPDEFERCDGSATPTEGVSLGQQPREVFGFSYQTIIGNELTADLGFKIHLVYNALAAPTEKAHSTVNDTPEAMTMSWEVSTTAVDVPGFKPAASLTIDSTRVSAEKLEELMDILYGTAGQDPRLPLPEEVIDIVSGSTAVVVPNAPTYVQATKVITIPAITGVIYQINGVTVPAGPRPPITVNTIVKAKPAAGYKFPVPTDDDWQFNI